MKLMTPLPILSRLSARLFVCATILLLQACATKPAPIKYYDFGPMTKAVDKAANSAPSCRLPPIVLDDITAPTALSSNSMLYRLLYANDQQVYSYANHRWNMTPTQLLTQRIKTQLAENGVKLIDNGIIDGRFNVMSVRLELEDFNHYFTDATHSYVQVQLRASVLRGRTLLDQTMFQQQVNADTPDAPGGAQAMRLATDQLILHLSHWLCEHQVQP